MLGSNYSGRSEDNLLKTLVTREEEEEKKSQILKILANNIFSLNCKQCICSAVLFLFFFFFFKYPQNFIP